MKFLDQLQNPPREFIRHPVLFLNGDLTAEELRRQLADFARPRHLRRGPAPAHVGLAPTSPIWVNATLPISARLSKPPPRWI